MSHNKLERKIILFLGLVFIVVGRPQDLFPILQPFRLALIFTAINLIYFLLNLKGIKLDILKESKIAKKYIIFYIIMFIGILFSIHKGRTFQFVIFIYSVNIVVYVLFVHYINDMEKLRTTCITMICASLIYAISTLAKGTFRDSRLAFGGMFDSNDLAYFLVSIIPLCFIFINSRSKFKKYISIANLAISTLTILLTGSRGSMYALIIIAFYILFTNKIIRSKVQKIAFISVIGIVIAFNIEKIPIDRFLGMTNYDDDYNLTSEQGRLGIYKKALTLTKNYPVTGVGAHCFPMALGKLREEMGLIPRWQTAHNSYLLISTELGIPGFLIFISIIGKCIFKIRKIPYQNEEDKKSHDIFKLGMICMLISAFFLSQGYSILFTIYFAIFTVIENYKKQSLLSRQ